MLSSTRNSNIELLRILCMLMVLILHFNNNCVNVGLTSFPENLTNELKWGFLLESFCIVAVNCFVLISGYFSINLRSRSILKFYLQCFSIGLVSYFIYVCVTPDVLSIKPLLGRLFAFSHNHWWFVISYLCLMLFSPILNTAVKNLSPKKLLVSILMFSIIIFYFGWYKWLERNNDGYSLLHFVFLYLIGRYIGEYVSLSSIRKYRWYSLFGYIIGCIGCFVLVLLRYYTEWKIRFHFEYDHPLVVLSAVCLLLLLLSFNFQSKLVNWCASSVFAAYLLQESPYFGRSFLYPFVAEWFDNITQFKIGGCILMSLSFLGLSVLLDKLLKPLSNQILKLYDYCVIKVNRYF